MSGNQTVHLPGTAMVPLVRAAARLAHADLGAYAVVGGLAVSARLDRAHRATADVDTVVDDDLPPSAIEVLRHLAGARPDGAHDNRVYLEGTKVDLIATGAVTEPDLEGLEVTLGRYGHVLPSLDAGLVDGLQRTFEEANELQRG